MFKKIFMAPIKRFASANSGVAATEFAMLFPIMLLLMYGAIEGRTAYNTGDRVKQAANILADIIAKQPQISPEEIDDLFIGVENIVQPLKRNKLQLVVASVIPDNSGNPVVQWSRQNKNNKTPWEPGKKIGERINNKDIIKDGHSVVYAWVVYKHKSGLTGRIVKDELEFKYDKVRFPRKSRRVDLCDYDASKDEYKNCI